MNRHADISIDPGYIDLLLHLDGAITADIAKRLASLQGITLPSRDDDELRSMLSVPSDCTSLNDFLLCFALPDSLMQTKEGLRLRKNTVIWNRPSGLQVSRKSFF